MKINKMFALMGAFLLMSAPLAMNASSQRAARKAVRAKSSKTVSKVAKPKQKKVLKETFTVNGVKFVMVQVEGGTFKMGATPDMGSNPGRDEVQVHTVTLSNFLIGQTEVTQALWQAVMGDNPSYFVGDDLPVERVCYHDCLDFIIKLNQLTGQKFRLPTESEWEYACPGGVNSRSSKYSGNNDPDVVAWYRDNSGSQTHPVATKAPNELGIYDMSGNVWEWCSDWYGYYELTKEHTNPTGPDSGRYGVRRGGAFNNSEWFVRASARGATYRPEPYMFLGFRLAL